MLATFYSINILGIIARPYNKQSSWSGFGKTTISQGKT